MDVKSDFLNAELEEVIYMEQPEVFQLFEAENCVYKLKKTLYGIKQDP